MTDTITVIKPGEQIEIGPDRCAAVVHSVTLEQSGQVNYTCATWDEGKRDTQYLHQSEVFAAYPDTAKTIGFSFPKN